MPREFRRRTPEECLRAVRAEEAAATRGHLKIFLGYASGVGKSFRMLDEARRRKERGQDVVVGGIQPHIPTEVEPLLSNLEVVPLRTDGQRSAIDLDRLLRRRPGVCIIDGLAYDNPSGSKNATRWQDVEELLKAGIKVIGSVNIQYIAELQDQTQAITGKRAGETVPIAFVKSASEIEIVDAPAQEPIDRSGEGRLDPSERQQQLSRLRELALVLAADVVDYQLTGYLESHGIRQSYGTQERLLVCVTPRANIHDMMEAALMIADRFHAELIVGYVNQPHLSPEDSAALEERLTIARAAGAHVVILEGKDPAETLIDFARSRGITQLFIGHTQRTGAKSWISESPIDKLIRLSQGMDVRIFPQ